MPTVEGARATAASKDGRSTATILVYNALYWPYLIGTCAVLFWPALALWGATFWWDKNLRLLHRYTVHWGAHYLLWAPLVSYEMTGHEGLGRGPFVYVSNHQSMVDILAVFGTKLDFKWVSKVENFYAPFIGWAMALNRYVPLKRGHLPSILKMFRRSIAWLAKGESVFVFPEGTRSPDGELQRFHRGAFALSTRCKVPVVPVVIEGTGQILQKGTMRIAPSPVTVRVLAPVDPAEVGFDSRKLRDLVHERMKAELARIREARSA